MSEESVLHRHLFNGSTFRILVASYDGVLHVLEVDIQGKALEVLRHVSSFRLSGDPVQMLPVRRETSQEVLVLDDSGALTLVGLVKSR